MHHTGRGGNTPHGILSGGARRPRRTAPVSPGATAGALLCASPPPLTLAAREKERWARMTLAGPGE